MTPSNYHPPYQGGRASQPQQEFGQTPRNSYSQAYGSSYGGVNAYGAMPMGSQNNTTRLLLLIVGWVVAFALPAVATVLNYAVHGADPLGLIFVPLFIGPIFFVLQAILNVSYLALPKEEGISVFHLWVGHVFWWGGALMVSVMFHTPGGFTEDKWNDGAYFDDPVLWDTLWSMTFIWALVAAVGFIWVIVGIVLAVRDGDNKRKFAYRQQPWGKA